MCDLLIFLQIRSYKNILIWIKIIFDKLYLLTVTQNLLFQSRWTENTWYLNFAEKDIFIFRILLLVLEYGTFWQMKRFTSGKFETVSSCWDMVITKEFLDNCITATNAYGEKTKNSQKSFLREFLTVKKYELFRKDILRLNGT